MQFPGMSSWKYCYQDTDGDYDERKLAAAKNEVLPLFLALPPKQIVHLGIDMNTDIYISIRNIRLDGTGAGVWTYIMMPASYNVQQQPIQLQPQCFDCVTPPEGLYIDHLDRFVNHLGEQKGEMVWVLPRANVLYRDIMNQIYKNYVSHHFIEMGLGYRPARILVDDPSLAMLIFSDLNGSGTTVEVVDERASIVPLVDMEGKNYAGGRVQEMVPLIGIANNIVQHQWKNELSPEERERSNDREAVRNSLLESKHVPGKYKMPKNSRVANYVVKACLYCGDVLQANVLKLCAKCVSSPQASRAYYCSSKCQKLHWPVHKKMHPKGPSTSTSSATIDDTVHQFELD
jgi:hypothetical protein